MVEMREAKAKPASKPRTHKRIIIEHGEGRTGGHVVTHESHGPEYEEPKKYIFGKGDGEKLLTHLKKHAKIHTAEEEGDTKTHERERKGWEEEEPEETDADIEAEEE